MTAQNRQLTTVEENLLTAIAEYNLSHEWVTGQIDDPTGAWWDYLPSAIRDLWNSLSYESRLVAFLAAWISFISPNSRDE